MFLSALRQWRVRKADGYSAIRRKTFKGSTQVAYILHLPGAEARIHLMGGPDGSRFYLPCSGCRSKPPGPCRHFPSEPELTKPEGIGELVAEALDGETDPLSAAMLAADAAIFLREEALRYAAFFWEIEQAALVAHERRKALEKRDQIMADPYLIMVRFSAR